MGAPRAQTNARQNGNRALHNSAPAGNWALGRIVRPRDRLLLAKVWSLTERIADEVAQLEVVERFAARFRSPFRICDQQGRPVPEQEAENHLCDDAPAHWPSLRRRYLPPTTLDRYLH